MTALAAFSVLAAALVAAAWAVLLANRRERAERALVLADCGDAMEGALPSVAPSGYGVLRGMFAGRPAALTPVAEALAFRRLPQLWLSAAIRDADEARPSIEIIRRPTGTEAFAGGADLPAAFRAPKSWPQDTLVRASRDAAPLLARLDAPLAAALRDPKLKAVIVSPHGVRVIRQAAQGARSGYLLFRDLRFDGAKVSSEEARSALELAVSIAELVSKDVSAVSRAAA